MRVLVCGGRNFGRVARSNPYPSARELARRQRACARATLDALDGVTAIIEGGATGADALAREWANSRGMKPETYEANWRDLEAPELLIRKLPNGQLYNAAAGGIRNQRMLDEGKPDLVVAFPGGTGTADMVARAKRAGVKVIEVGA